MNKIWFLTCQTPVLSGRTSFESFLKTWNIFTPKFPMKCSKNVQNFVTPKNTLNVIFETCWTPCKKPHFSMWPRSRNTFFGLTPYLSKSKKVFSGKNSSKSKGAIIEILPPLFFSGAGMRVKISPALQKTYQN